MLLQKSMAIVMSRLKLGQQEWWSTLRRAHERLAVITFAAQMYATKVVWANEAFAECTIGIGAGRWIRKKG